MTDAAAQPSADRPDEDFTSQDTPVKMPLPDLDALGIEDPGQVTPQLLAERLQELLDNTLKYLVQAMVEAPDAGVEQELALILSKVQQLQSETSEALAEIGLGDSGTSSKDGES